MNALARARPISLSSRLYPHLRTGSVSWKERLSRVLPESETMTRQPTMD